MVSGTQSYIVRNAMETFTLNNYTNRFQARYWAATIPITSEVQEQYVLENAGTAHTYTTPASDNDVVIRWGHLEETDKTFNGKHVHVWIAVLQGATGLKKRITKRMAYQRLTSALRMCELEVADIPYLAPLNNRLAYETYMDKTHNDEENGWRTHGITNVGYLRKVTAEVGTDLYRIYRKIHMDTGLALQKIVSQRAGIQAYIDMAKTVKTGTIKQRINNRNAVDVKLIVDNILENTECKTNRIKRIELLTTLLYMSTVDRHADDGIRAPLLWSTTEGTGKSSTLKIIPESMRKQMVTDAGGVGANDFRVDENVFVMEDITIRDITEEKRGVVWALATGSNTTVKIHSSSKKIEPKWVIGTTNENIPEVYKLMKNGSEKDRTNITGMQTRFMDVKYEKKFRGTNDEQALMMDENARLELFIRIMAEIAARPDDFKKAYERNVFRALYMIEAARIIENDNKDHPLFKSKSYRQVIEGLNDYVENSQTEMHMRAATEEKDYEQMMANVSTGLGLRSEDEMDRIGQELETAMRDIAELEGIDLDDLLNTPIPHENEIAAIIGDMADGTPFNSQASTVEFETDTQREERHSEWLNTSAGRNATAWLEQPAHQALKHAPIIHTPEDRPPPVNPTYKRKQNPTWVMSKNKKMLKLDVFDDVSDIEPLEDPFEHTYGQPASPDSPDWGRKYNCADPELMAVQIPYSDA